MNLVFNAAKWVVYIEFALIAVIIVITCLIKIFIYFHNKYQQTVSKNITDYLIKAEPDIRYFDQHKFKKNWRKLNILLPIINKLELQLDPKWEAVRILFFQSVVLPLARINAVSKNWGYRYYAAKAFSLFFEIHDEPYILKLVNDKIPLIRYNAIIPAVLCGSEKAMDNIIFQIAKEPWLSQFIYLREFYNASGTSRIYIENQLQTSVDSKIRYVCYKLLLNYAPLKYTWDYERDMHSSDATLKMAALMYITYVDREAALPLIKRSLKDKDWQVRAAALICIRNLKSVALIDDVVHCLNDSHSWVRLVAMQTLYDLGEKGKQKLISKEIIYEPVALDILNHVIKM